VGFNERNLAMMNRLRALDTISACLMVNKSREQIESNARRIRLQKIAWEKVVWLANQHLLSPALWVELQHQGLEQLLPDELRSYLCDLHRLSLQRNQHLRQQVIDVARVCNAVGVEPILLKGAVSLFSSAYLDPGARVMTDIDILVPREQATECWTLLCDNSYLPIDEYGHDWSRHHHLHPLERPGAYATVEIHREVLPPSSTGRLFGITLSEDDSRLITDMLVEGSVPFAEGPVAMRRPNPTHRLLHCLLHSAFNELNAYRAGTLPLRSLYELAWLQNFFLDDIDWETINHVMSSGKKSSLFRAWVYLAHRLFGSDLPPGCTATPGMWAHHLRCRLQASLGLSVTLTSVARV
jgi:hypothetical protein